jgi:hypothetical protein
MQEIKGESVRNQQWFKELTDRLIKAHVQYNTSREPFKMEIFGSPRGRLDYKYTCVVGKLESFEVISEDDDGVS